MPDKFLTRYNPDIYHRHSIRLRDYDYSLAGAYFVTICTKDRECLFGEIRGGKMVLNEAGRMLKSIWNELPQHCSDVDIDGFVVMPNHIHGIIVLTVGAGPRACPKDERSHNEGGQPQGVAPTISLPDVVHRFKSLATARYRQGVRENNWRPFPGTLWQRNYYEHIIRTEEEWNRFREYIQNNPMQWEVDEENPERDAREEGA
jgi:REP element-mobilizing transposase RayT